MKTQVFDEIMNVFVKRIVESMMESDTVNEILGAYVDYNVKMLTGFSTDDWKA